MKCQLFLASVLTQEIVLGQMTGFECHSHYIKSIKYYI